MVGEQVADLGIEGQLEAAAVEAPLDQLSAELLVGDEDLTAGVRVELDLAGGWIDRRRGAVEDVAAQAVAELRGEEIDQDPADAGGIEAPAAGGAQDRIEREDEISLGVPVPAGEVEAEDETIGETVSALEENFRDARRADVNAGGEIAGERTDEEAGQVADDLAAAVSFPGVPGGKVEGVLEGGEVGLQADLFDSLFFGLLSIRRNLAFLAPRIGRVQPARKGVELADAAVPPEREREVVGDPGKGRLEQALGKNRVFGIAGEPEDVVHVARLIGTAVETDEFLPPLLAPERGGHDRLGPVEADPDPAAEIAGERPDFLRDTFRVGTQELLDEDPRAVGEDDRLRRERAVGDALEGALAVAGGDRVDPDLAAGFRGAPELGPAPGIDDLGGLVVEEKAFHVDAAVGAAVVAGGAEEDAQTVAPGETTIGLGGAVAQRAAKERIC